MDNFIQLTLISAKNLEFFFTLFLALLSGLSIRITLGITGQRWVQTYHQTLTYIILPITTLVITKVIAGNIALSLGMIGALSIVRFRNPVKSPFELSMFFALVTIGISMGVNYKWGLLLTVTIILIIIFAKLLDNLSSKMGKRLFTTSFDEASQKIFLEIDCKTELNFLYDNDNLVQISKIDKNNYFYRLIFVNKKEIDELKKLLDSKDISYEIRYNF